MSSGQAEDMTRQTIRLSYHTTILNYETGIRMADVRMYKLSIHAIWKCETERERRKRNMDITERTEQQADTARQGT